VVRCAVAAAAAVAVALAVTDLIKTRATPNPQSRNTQ
jgi:hypothetical protein